MSPETRPPLPAEANDTLRGSNKSAPCTCRSAATTLLHYCAGTLSPAACRPTPAPPSSLLRRAPGSSPRILRSVSLIQLLDIPQHVRLEDRRMKIPDALFGAYENVRAGHKNHRLILRHDFLHAVVELLALRGIRPRQQLLHPASNLPFPIPGRVCLRRIPQVHAAS